MNNIEVPFMPISSFDASVVSKNFEEPLSEDDEKYLMPSVNDDNDDMFSEEIMLILIGIGMEKYAGLFRRHFMLLDTFLQLNDTDLQEIGITDPEDRAIIIKNLSIHQKTRSDCIVPQNLSEDAKIMENVFYHVHLLHNYCSYVELQMKKYKYSDYRINSEESACTYLKAFTEAALIQSKIMCDTLYDQENFDYLLNEVYKKKQTVLRDRLTKYLPKKKERSKFPVYKLMMLLGFASVILLIGNNFIKHLSVASWIK